LRSAAKTPTLGIIGELLSATLLASPLGFPSVQLLLFAALLGSLMVTDHAASDGASDAMMHEVARETAHDRAFDAAFGMAL